MTHLNSPISVKALFIIFRSYCKKQTRLHCKKAALRDIKNCKKYIAGGIMRMKLWSMHAPANGQNWNKNQVILYETAIKKYELGVPSL